MKIGVYFYSGAGNTEYAALKIKEAFQDLGSDAETVRITQDTAPPDNKYDMIGIGFPVHYREVPALVPQTAAQWDGQSRPVFTFATKGLYSGNAARNLLLLLKEKDFVPVGHREFYLPGTDGLVLFAKKGSVWEKLLKAMRTRKLHRKIDRFVEAVQKKKPMPVLGEKWYTTFEKILVKPLEARFTNNYEMFIGKFYSMEDRCTKCALCERQCPRGNIIVGDRGVTFGTSCDACLRCIHRCPTEAIQIGDSTPETVRFQPLKELPRLYHEDDSGLPADAS
jgi:NAD-dependent dihydropyrimidine dehydrogenase PreA subunit